MKTQQDDDAMLGGGHKDDYAALMIQKMQSLEDKMDRLTQNTRVDLEKLRNELASAFVPRDSYEPRHAALIERDAQIEASLREMRRDQVETMHKMQAGFDQGLRRHSDKMEAISKKVDERFKQQGESTLSDVDRKWLRISQLLGVAATAIAIAALILQHINIH